MTKEELIKQAFEIGWNSYHECASNLDYEEALVHCLSNLNENNGWIKIESENDLPKEYTECFLFDDDNDIGFYTFGLDDNNDLKYKENGITHYQLIIKPEPPIY